MKNESAAPSRVGLWILITLSAAMLYFVGSGVSHGLYYNERISEETWNAAQKVYAPVDWLESKLGEDNLIFNLKYWWYIKIKYGWQKEVDWRKS
jgi:hypothetical protein